MKRIITTLICLPILAAMLFSLCFSAGAVQDNEPLRYGKTTITDPKVLYVYNQLEAAYDAEDTPEVIEFDQGKGLVGKNVEDGLGLFLCDYPEYFWIDRTSPNWKEGMIEGKVVSLTPVYYSFTGSQLIQAKKDLNKAIEELIKDMPAGSNHEKAHYLHDELAKKVTYVEDGLHQTAYGALVAGKAVCAGYASAYQILCHNAGIECWKINGNSVNPSTGESIGHAWNLVWMDANTCVYTDVTWDDQETLSHYYFNLSKSEIDEGHEAEALFKLPECDHDDQSYYDIDAPDHNVDDDITAEEFATLFAPDKDGNRVATFCYNGDDLNALFTESFLVDTLVALDADLYKPASIETTQNSREITMTFKATFSAHSFTLDIIIDNVKPDTQKLFHQNVLAGQPIKDITINAKSGYYFPDNYTSYLSPQLPMTGLTVTRVSRTQLKISGTLTGSYRIELLEALALPQQPTPNCPFTAIGADSGILAVTSGMEYSINGNDWEPIYHTGNIAFNGTLKAGDHISIRMPGDDIESTTSDVQTIEMFKAETPSLTATSPDSADAKGTINTNITHEYSVDNINWIPCEGVLTDLAAGTYYVRVAANGSILASDTQELTIVAFVPPVEEAPNEPLPPADDEEDKGEDDSADEQDKADVENGVENKDENDSENNDQPAVNETEKPTEKPTEQVTEAPTQKPDDATDKPDVNVNVNVRGCGAVADGAVVTLMVAALGSCLALKKKED